MTTAYFRYRVGCGYPPNDSAVNAFLNKHHCNLYACGRVKNQKGTPVWHSNQEEGTYRLVSTDRSLWDIPVKHYERFLGLVFNEPPQYKQYFIETLYDVHKMYLDFDFKTSAPVDYDELVEVVELTCEFVHQFFDGADEQVCHVAACEPYPLTGKDQGKFKSGLHFYFSNIVTNAHHAMNCRNYVVKELLATKGDPDYAVPVYDWDEVVDESVFNGSKKGALRLNNTYKREDCKEPLCKKKLKAAKNYRDAKDEPEKEQRRRKFLKREKLESELGITWETGCCRRGHVTKGSPYKPWLRLRDGAVDQATYDNTLPYTNWSLLVDQKARMTTFDRALVVPGVLLPPSANKRPAEAVIRVPARQNRVNKYSSQVTLYDSKTVRFLTEQLVQKLAFRANRESVCSEYSRWVSKLDGLVRPYRDAYVSKVVALYDGEDKGHTERDAKNFKFFVPLMGPDRNNCYGHQHASNGAKLKITHNNRQYVDVELGCYKEKQCQHRPKNPLQIRYKLGAMSTVFYVLMVEAAKELGLKQCAPLPHGFKLPNDLVLDHEKALYGGPPEWPPRRFCAHTTFDFALEDSTDSSEEGAPAPQERAPPRPKKRSKRARLPWSK